MTQPETEIRRAWRHVAGPHHDGYVDALLRRYAEPHRSYHTATHIMFVLRHVHDVTRPEWVLPVPGVAACGCLPPQGRALRHRRLPPSSRPEPDCPGESPKV